VARPGRARAALRLCTAARSTWGTDFIQTEVVGETLSTTVAWDVKVEWNELLLERGGWEREERAHDSTAPRDPRVVVFVVRASYVNERGRVPLRPPRRTPLIPR
jgi:hypothetical protein